ncbi:Retrovirus-related Pol polyprotein from transposon TNT 1-94 [Senna tora]|uniref:Retrovirus-related Pol polyprotein from transposon TNT 1-94 n=1 Tax=Senna tora TaxID=362788 RepID=A0A834WIP1_9FABA|nr:Retrovirus-related Pol polyprotein from transposon TNT 1-94 [Senna tora]
MSLSFFQIKNHYGFSRIQLQDDDVFDSERFRDCGPDQGHRNHPRAQTEQFHSGCNAMFLRNSLRLTTKRKAYSYQIWEKLGEIFSSATRAHERQLKSDLRNTKKSTLSMSDFILKIKKITDSLAAIGSPVSTNDHIESILDGLGQGYEGFITSFAMHKHDFTITELKALLLSQEARTERFKKTLNNVSANVAQKGFGQSSKTSQGQFFPNSRGGFQGRGYGNNSSFPSFRGNSQNRGRSRGGRTWQGQRPQCQVCGKLGHIGVNCHNRFNQNFTEASLNQYLSQNGTSSTQPTQTRPPTTPSVEALLATPETLSDDTWFADSGASNHLTNDVTNLQNKQPYEGTGQVHIANGSGLNVAHIGNSELLTDSTTLQLNTILHVPTVSKNLLSISRFAHDNNVYFEFHANKCLIKSQVDHKTLLKGRLEHSLYLFDTLKLSHKAPKSFSAHTATVSTSESDFRNFGVWHCRLGHPSTSVVKTVLSHCNISLNNKNKNIQPFCEACCLGKMHALPFYPSSTIYTKPLELVYSDLWGPAPVLSSRGYKYYIMFIDAFSKYTWIYLLKAKSDALEAFQLFKLNTKIKALQSDSGGEYRAFSKFLQTHGIHHRFSCPHTHQQNGSAERKHRHISWPLFVGQCISSPSFLGRGFPYCYKLVASSTAPAVPIPDKSPAIPLVSRFALPNTTIDTHNHSTPAHLNQPHTVSTVHNNVSAASSLSPSRDSETVPKNTELLTTSRASPSSPTTILPASPASLTLPLPVTNAHPMVSGQLSLFILVYVDDVIITGNSVSAIRQLVTLLGRQFALKDLGDLHFFLGLHARSTSDGGLLLTQTQYVKDLLTKSGMSGVAPQKTPMTSELKLSAFGSEPFPDPHQYRSVVGALQYVTVTRPDLSFAVNKVC